MDKDFISWSRNGHRGPYKLLVLRPAKKGKGFVTSEWLNGESLDKDDVAEEAKAILTDPRDTVFNVQVWSLREDCFVHSFRKGEAPCVNA